MPARAYQGQDCAQIFVDKQQAQLRLAELAAQLDNSVVKNNMLASVGLIAFWPALLAVDDTKPLAAEYSRYKGWAEALAQAQSSLECPARATIPSAALD